MGDWRSIRFCNRVRISERGWALAMAVILAVLYFGLIELLMIDSSRALAEARRFRARVIAATLAENGAELAAHQIVNDGTPAVSYSDELGTMTGKRQKSGPNFVLTGEGETAGLIVTKAKVEVTGYVENNRLVIQWTTHTP